MYYKKKDKQKEHTSHISLRTHAKSHAHTRSITWVAALAMPVRSSWVCPRFPPAPGALGSIPPGAPGVPVSLAKVSPT